MDFLKRLRQPEKVKPPKPEPPKPPGGPIGVTPPSVPNFLEVSISEPTGITNEPTITLIGRTMRRLGVGGTKPTIEVYIRGSRELVSFGAMSLPTDDRLVCAFSHVLNLPEGQSDVRVIADNGTPVEQIFNLTRLTLEASCDIRVNGLVSAYLPAGGHTVQLTSDFDLTQAPTLVASIGNLGAFVGGPKVWTATLNIVGGQNGSGTFSNAQLVNAAGTGTVINTGASYTVDTTAPTIVSGLFSATVWHSPDGTVTLTVACGESTTGWIGYVDLSAFGQSSSASLSPSGNNMVRTFTPTKQDAGPVAAGNIRVYDRAGNAATNNGVSSDNQLQTFGYLIAPEDLTFPPKSAVSNPLSGGQSFTDPAYVVVEWGDSGMAQPWPSSGVLTSPTDYVIADNNKIHLDETLYAVEIQANATGLMFVVVKED